MERSLKKLQKKIDFNIFRYEYLTKEISKVMKENEVVKMETKNIPDKQVKIAYEWHEKLRKVAFQEKKEMRQIVHEALELYINQKNRRG